MSNRDPKQIILDAALATFAEHGFDRTTTAQIIGRAGISNGALFHHFASKGAIAEALYLRGIASYQKGLVQAMKRHRGSGKARAAVRAAVQHHLAWVEANRHLAWFMYERGRPDWQPAQGVEVRKLNRMTAIEIRDWMAPLVAAGEIKDLPLAALAALVNGPAHFVARRWLSGLIRSRATSFTDVLADAAWAAVSPHRPRPSSAPPPRLSSAALIETASLDAVLSSTQVAAVGAWTIVHLAMSTVSHAALSPTSAEVRSVRMENDGHIALVDVELLDAAGNITTRGNVVCIRRDNAPASPLADIATGP